MDRNEEDRGHISFSAANVRLWTSVLGTTGTHLSASNAGRYCVVHLLGPALTLDGRPAIVIHNDHALHRGLSSVGSAPIGCIYMMLLSI